MESLIYLDTHAVVWLHSGQLGLFPQRALDAVRDNALFISPFVALEIQYLFETERIAFKSETVLNELSDSLGLQVCKHDFNKVIAKSLNMNWTRDPFDRIITAQASILNSALLTKDQIIRKYYRYAFWD
ncbi:MAG TPA: PIN domain-containing protein [bacterium]